MQYTTNPDLDQAMERTKRRMRTMRRKALAFDTLTNAIRVGTPLDSLAKLAAFLGEEIDCELN